LKKLIFFILSVLSYQTLLSQSVIPKFGVTQTTVDFSDELSSGTDISERYGMIVGLGVEFPLNKWLSVTPELLFQQKGWKQKFSYADSAGSNNYKLNYIEVPVLVKFKLGFFYLNAGPYGAVAMGGKLKYKYYASGQKHIDSNQILLGRNNTTNPDILYLDNAFDAGVKVGFGFKVFNRVYLDFRYSMSFVNIYNEQNWLDDNKSKTKGFEITIGFPSPRE
jgi:hypothetical protein